MDFKQLFLDSLNDSQMGFYYAHEHKPNIDELLQDELTKIQYDKFMDYYEDSRMVASLQKTADAKLNLTSTLISIQDTLKDIMSELTFLRTEQKTLQKEVEALKNMKSNLNSNTTGNIAVENWEQSTVTSGVFSGTSEIDAASNADETRTLAESVESESTEDQTDKSGKLEYYKEFLGKVTCEICDLSYHLRQEEANTGVMSRCVEFIRKIQDSLAPEDKYLLRDFRIVTLVMHYYSMPDREDNEEEYLILLRESLGSCEISNLIECDGLYKLRKSFSSCWSQRAYSAGKLFSILQIYGVIAYHEPLVLKDELDIFRMVLDETKNVDFLAKFETVCLLCFYLFNESEENELPKSRNVLLELIQKEINSWTLGSEMVFDLEKLRKLDSFVCRAKLPVCNLFGAWTLANLATLDPEGFGTQLAEHCQGTDRISEQFLYSNPNVTKFVKLAFQLTNTVS